MEKVIRLALILVVLVIWPITFTPNIFARDYEYVSTDDTYTPSQTNSSDGPTTCQGVANGVGKVWPWLGQTINEKVCGIPKEQSQVVIGTPKVEVLTPTVQPAQPLVCPPDNFADILEDYCQKNLSGEFSCQEIAPTKELLDRMPSADSNGNFYFIPPLPEDLKSIFIGPSECELVYVSQVGKVVDVKMEPQTNVIREINIKACPVSESNIDAFQKAYREQFLEPVLPSEDIPKYMEDVELKPNTLAKVDILDDSSCVVNYTSPNENKVGATLDMTTNKILDMEIFEPEEYEWCNAATTQSNIENTLKGYSGNMEIQKIGKIEPTTIQVLPIGYGHSHCAVTFNDENGNLYGIDFGKSVNSGIDIWNLTKSQLLNPTFDSP